MEVQALARSMEIAVRALECPFWLSPLSICHVAVGDLWAGAKVQRTLLLLKLI